MSAFCYFHAQSWQSESGHHHGQSQALLCAYIFPAMCAFMYIIYAPKEGCPTSFAQIYSVDGIHAVDLARALHDGDLTVIP